MIDKDDCSSGAERDSTAGRILPMEWIQGLKREQSQAELLHFGLSYQTNTDFIY